MIYPIVVFIFYNDIPQHTRDFANMHCRFLCNSFCEFILYFTRIVALYTLIVL